MSPPKTPELIGQIKRICFFSPLRVVLTGKQIAACGGIPTKQILMKKLLSTFLIRLMLCSAFTGCSEGSKLNPDDPVTLTMWHVYSEQIDSPMNRLSAKFNKTVRAEKGIIINVTMMFNTFQIGQKLLNAG